jgi:hypothetical protein
MMSDDFMDLLSGEGAKPQGQGERGMEEMLGSLLGGGSAGGLGDLLGGLLGGGGASTQSGDTSDMAGVLGGLMGGSAAGASSSGLGDLLGGLMGGGGSSAGGLGGLLGGLMGSGSDQMTFGGGGGASLPFAGTLAEKLGISEQMANMLIMGAIGLLTSSLAKQRSSGRAGAVNYADLSDPDFIRSSGVAGQLSGRMGISEDEAIYGLQQTMGLLAAGGQPTASRPKTASKKTTARKTAAAPKKASSKATKTTPKKSTKKKSSSEFQDLLDESNR